MRGAVAVGYSRAMARQITVSVQEDHLAKYARSPMRGVEELVWNAIDADAENIDIVIDRNAADGVDAVHVRDDGHGMTPTEVEAVFGRLGGSWKLVETKSRQKGRPLHGRHGAGRYYAFGIHGSTVRWRTVAEVAPGQRQRTVVEGSPSRMTSFVLQDGVPTTEPAGTTVSILGMSEEPRSLTSPAARDRVTATFALALAAHQVRITFDGEALDLSSVLRDQEDFDVPVETGRGPVTLSVIEWSPTVHVEPVLHLCTPEGASLHVTSPGSAGARHRYTAYARWQGFRDFEPELALDGMPHPELAPVLDAVRMRLADYWSKRDAETDQGYIAEWRAQQVYPYRTAPSTIVEAAEQELFEKVALAAARAVNISPETRARRTTLGLLREAVLSGRACPSEKLSNQTLVALGVRVTFSTRSPRLPTRSAGTSSRWARSAAFARGRAAARLGLRCCSSMRTVGGGFSRRSRPPGSCVRWFRSLSPRTAELPALRPVGAASTPPQAYRTGSRLRSTDGPRGTWSTVS